MAKMTGFKVFRGTKQAFIEGGKATANADAIVFITGGSDAKGSCIFAQGVYFANFTEFLAAINYVKGVKVGTDTYNASSGGGYVAFESVDPSTLSLDVANGKLQFGLTTDFVNKVNNTKTDLGSKTDAANKDGSAFARIANLAALVSDLTGGSTDSIEGQITTAINTLRTEIVGTLGTTDAKTLQAINDELNTLFSNMAGVTINGKHIVDAEVPQNVVLTGGDIVVGGTSADFEGTDYSTNTIENTIKDIDSRFLETSSDAEVSIVESTANANYAKVYTIYQGGNADSDIVGRINIPKDLVVKSGEVVVNPSGQAAGTYIKLTLQNDESHPLYINVGDLIDVYTPQANATQVQVAISDTNVISATIKGSSITSTELANESVTSAKIKDSNVTKSKLAQDVLDLIIAGGNAYQKPETGIPYEDLSDEVREALDMGETALQMSNLTNGDYIDISKTTSNATFTATTKTISTATALKQGLADAYDVKTYADSLFEWEEL